jgi:hypothetical protein
MHPSQRRIRSRRSELDRERRGRLAGRRSLAALAVGAAITLAAGSAVAARGPGGSPSSAGPATRTSTSTRPAAPVAMPDAPWLVQRGDGRWVYGHGEHGTVRRLPADETGLAIDEGLVATTLAGTSGHSIVRFRDRRTGRTTIDVAAPIWVSAGAWTARGLVVTGYGDGSMTSDGGLLMVEPSSGTAAVLVAGGPFSIALGRPVARGDVEVSPSGTTVASNACGLERCDLQVVALTTGRVDRPIAAAEGFLRAVTDDAAVTTDDGYRWISARRFADGSEIWRLRDMALIDPIATADGAIVGLVGSSRAGWAVASIDRTGEIRDLTDRTRGSQALPRIWRAVSDHAVLVVGRAPLEDLVDGGATEVTLIAPGPGRATAATIHLPPATEAVP